MPYEEDIRNILRLRLPTDPRWVDLASMSLTEILTDHAYCEQKVVAKDGAATLRAGTRQCPVVAAIRRIRLEVRRNDGTILPFEICGIDICRGFREDRRLRVYGTVRYDRGQGVGHFGEEHPEILLTKCL